MYYDDYYGNGYYGSGYSQGCTGEGIVVFIILIILAIAVAFGLLAMREAERQDRSKVAWFWLGFFFNISAFIALKVSKAADDEGHSMTLWSVLGILLGIYTIIAFEAALNAENKGHDFDCWCILGFVGGILALFISCFLKPFEKASGEVKPAVAKPPREVAWTCAKCGKVNPAGTAYCPICGNAKFNPENK